MSSLNNVNQLAPPYLILGDINGQNRIWGSARTCGRGNIVEEFLNVNNLNVLNDGTPMRVTLTAESAIDLSICTPILQIDSQWSVLHTPRDSDHSPILITFSSNIIENDESIIKNYNRANWEVYSMHKVWENTPEEHSSTAGMLQDFYERLNMAADDALPKFTVCKFFPKPWWSKEVQKSYKERDPGNKIVIIIL